MSTSTPPPSTTSPIRDPAALIDVQAVAALLDCSPRHGNKLDCYRRHAHTKCMVSVELTPEAAEQFDRLPLVIRARVDRLRERLRQWPVDKIGHRREFYED